MSIIPNPFLFIVENLHPIHFIFLDLSSGPINAYPYHQACLSFFYNLNGDASQTTQTLDVQVISDNGKRHLLFYQANNTGGLWIRGAVDIPMLGVFEVILNIIHNKFRLFLQEFILIMILKLLYYKMKLSVCTQISREILPIQRNNKHLKLCKISEGSLIN